MQLQFPKSVLWEIPQVFILNTQFNKSYPLSLRNEI